MMSIFLSVVMGLRSSSSPQDMSNADRKIDGIPKAVFLDKFSSFHFLFFVFKGR